ncbi:hypothetical protein M9Y10_015153 [Tritrichomonas musculus]|uniref:IPT/TIG domain-containing protein n=1 Tax=Tritrichomonas musculus TaxID=1915356 RepID=A0ABR2L1I5_9EUKA
MIFFIFLQINAYFPPNNAQLQSTFCICQDSYQVNCSKICGQYKIIDFKYSSISNCLKDYNQELINFLIAGTISNSSKTMPKFDLNDFNNISAVVYSAGQSIYSARNNSTKFSDGREHIILYNGTAGNKTNILFTNINIHFHPGKYKFNNLHLFNTDFTPFQTTGVVTSLFQRYLTCDYGSISRMPVIIKHHGPTKGAEIECDKDVNNIQFLKNENIVFSGPSDLVRECLIDLSQVGQKYNTTIILPSREINITFDPVPKDEYEIPKIIFKLQSNSKIFINSDQFEYEKMPINRITFIHKSKTLYLYSKNGTTPPIFSYVGNGYRYLNDKKRIFHNSYCICQKLSCEEKCGKNTEIINGFDSISLDQTVVGNPSESLTYYIANTQETEGNYPVFDLEHFGDRKLNVIGVSSEEHIGFIGDATDDVGQFSFSQLTMHTKNGESSLLFPNVSFHKVKIYQLQFARKSKIQSETLKKEVDKENSTQKQNKVSDLSFLPAKQYFLKSTYLIIDYSTLENFVTNNVFITAPQNGVEIHTASISSDVSLRFFTSSHVEVNKLVNMSMMPHTTLSIYTTKNVNFLISPHFPKVVSSFPKLRIIIEGDESNVTFSDSAGWPEELSDISAKVTIIHGYNIVYLVGHFDSEKNEYSTKPPIVDHKGNGPFFLNGILSNFKTAYCICSGQRCTEQCSESIVDSISKEEENVGDFGISDKKVSLWPPINFTENDIEKTVVGNPTKHIEYFIHGSSPDNRPLFGLHSFRSKSFTIFGCDDKKFDEFDRKSDNDVYQYISLEGTNQIGEIVTSSVSHIFKNVNILLANPGIYFFNNVVFKNCQIERNKSISLVPKDGMRKYFNIIHSGMTIDMKTLHSFSNIKSDELAVPTSMYLKVIGDENLAKIFIEDMYHLVLMNKFDQLDSRIDISLLKRNPPSLITLYGTKENSPLFVIFKKNKEINKVDDIPRFIIDVSNMKGEDAYISFIGQKWMGEFKNLSSRIIIKHGTINVHLISEKVVKDKRKNKFIKIIPPIIKLDGTGDIYIDSSKQLSGISYLNGNLIIDNRNDYEDEDEEERREKLHYLIMISVCGVLIIIIIVAVISVLKKRKLENYGQMRKPAYFSNHKFENDINYLPKEQFEQVEEQSE